MLLRLLTTYLRPYRTWLLGVLTLQFVATIASLYLPSLNADIIDQGVALGDTSYILRTGMAMLAMRGRTTTAAEPPASRVGATAGAGSSCVRVAVPPTYQRPPGPLNSMLPCGALASLGS